MRLRVTFSKSGMLRYTGHLDLHRLWERTCRRASIPLKYSQGFHPQPRISIGSALPLGFIGMAELIDIQLDEDRDPDSIREKLKNAAPPGLDISSIAIVDPKLPALQTQIESADYRVEFLDLVDSSQLEESIATVLEANSIPRVRKGKNYDLRPLILSLTLEGNPEREKPGLSMRLKAEPGATGRPEEVLSELGITPEGSRITRISLNLSKTE
ncbi:TIGR03936 family radical SAM-associated protein [Chloroflexota bacterium]